MKLNWKVGDLAWWKGLSVVVEEVDGANQPVIVRGAGGAYDPRVCPRWLMRRGGETREEILGEIADGRHMTADAAMSSSTYSQSILEHLKRFYGAGTEPMQCPPMPAEPAHDAARFPHFCPWCGRHAYVGARVIEHEDGGECER